MHCIKWNIICVTHSNTYYSMPSGMCKLLLLLVSSCIEFKNMNRIFFSPQNEKETLYSHKITIYNNRNALANTFGYCTCTVVVYTIMVSYLIRCVFIFFNTLLFKYCKMCMFSFVLFCIDCRCIRLVYFF